MDLAAPSSCWMVSSEENCDFESYVGAFLLVFMGCLSFLFIRDWLNEHFTVLDAIQLHIQFYTLLSRISCLLSPYSLLIPCYFAHIA